MAFVLGKEKRKKEKRWKSGKWWSQKGKCVKWNVWVVDSYKCIFIKFVRECGVNFVSMFPRKLMDCTLYSIVNCSVLHTLWAQSYYAMLLLRMSCTLWDESWWWYWQHALTCQFLLLVYGIEVTILVYGYTRTKSRNGNSKVAFSLRLDGQFNRCLPKLLNYGCDHCLTEHQKQKCAV